MPEKINTITKIEGEVSDKAKNLTQILEISAIIWYDKIYMCA